MNIGVGLPTAISGAEGALISEWAICADEGPFSSLGVLDRLAYDSYDPLVALASAVAVTRRVQLATTIIVSLLHSTALLAKTTASLHALSGGRLIVGLSVGARKEDYTAAAVDYQDRGKRFAAQLAALQVAWEDEQVCPHIARIGAPPILVGGTSDQSYSRMARYADGYIHGGGPPRAFARAADKARAAWLDAGRPGKPRLWGQGYFAFGDAAIEAGTRYLRDYYAFTGPFVEHIVAELLTSPQAVAQFIRGYAEAGCGELILFPTVADITQLEQLATIVATLQQDNALLVERGSV